MVRLVSVMALIKAIISCARVGRAWVGVAMEGALVVMVLDDKVGLSTTVGMSGVGATDRAPSSTVGTNVVVAVGGTMGAWTMSSTGGAVGKAVVVVVVPVTVGTSVVSAAVGALVGTLVGAALVRGGTLGGKVAMTRPEGGPKMLRTGAKEGDMTAVGGGSKLLRLRDNDSLGLDLAHARLDWSHTRLVMNCAMRVTAMTVSAVAMHHKLAVWRSRAALLLLLVVLAAALPAAAAAVARRGYTSVGGGACGSLERGEYRDCVVDTGW
jgi:hypothetical protein